MEKVEAIEILTGYMSGKIDPESTELHHAIELAVDILESQTPLPSNLDEAANRQAALEQPYKWEEEQDGSFSITPLFVMSNIRSAFKAGAEWMAGQGVTEVSRLYRDPNPPHEGLFFGVLPFFSTIEMALNYQDGEEVIVQIRKKE